MANTECSIYFHPEAYSTAGNKLMGRNVAGESFLRGYFEHGTADTLWAAVRNQEAADAFANMARATSNQREIQAYMPEQMGVTQRPGAIFYPGPDVGDLAFQRSFFGADKWSICGITHTTSSARAMDAITSWVTQPLNSWDAIICPSNAVKQNVELVFQTELARLEKRLGITKCPMPQLPVIPLGVRTDDFRFNQAQRINARQSLGIKQETFVVLFMGRLSFHAKANPLPMYKALEILSTTTGADVRLIECGWHATEGIEAAYEMAHRQLCPSVQVTVLDGRNKKNRDTAWASADVFCSLPDNIQETFGISPIEAMAAGLPVIVSDWNGYKDTATAECGYRITTSMPAPGLGNDLAYRHATRCDDYDYYCGHTGTFIGVDVSECCSALEALYLDSTLRMKMGAEGRKRAVTLYDWSQVIPQYEALWDEQQQRRAAVTSGQTIWPARMDPYAAFSHYASCSMSGSSEIKLAYENFDEAKLELQKLLVLEIVRYAHKVIQPEEELLRALIAVPNDWAPVADIFRGKHFNDELIAQRSLSFLHKLGLVNLRRSQTS